MEIQRESNEMGVAVNERNVGKLYHRCQVHFLNNLADPVLVHDTELRKGLRDAVGYVSAPPEVIDDERDEEEHEASPPF